MILDVPGIDAVYVGPGDLGMSIGLPLAVDREEPEILGHYETILRACERRGIQAGLHTATAAYATRMMRLGSRFVVLASDSGLMMRAATAEVLSMREARQAHAAELVAA